MSKFSIDFCGKMGKWFLKIKHFDSPFGVVIFAFYSFVCLLFQNQNNVEYYVVYNGVKWWKLPAQFGIYTKTHKKASNKFIYDIQVYMVTWYDTNIGYNNNRIYHRKISNWIIVRWNKINLRFEFWMEVERCFQRIHRTVCAVCCWWSFVRRMFLFVILFTVYFCILLLWMTEHY